MEVFYSNIIWFSIFNVFSIGLIVGLTKLWNKESLESGSGKQ